MSETDPEMSRTNLVIILARIMSHSHFLQILCFPKDTLPGTVKVGDRSELISNCYFLNFRAARNPKFERLSSIFEYFIEHFRNSKEK